jgi:hypothetical protein
MAPYLSDGRWAVMTPQSRSALPARSPTAWARAGASARAARCVLTLSPPRCAAGVGPRRPSNVCGRPQIPSGLAAGADAEAPLATLRLCPCSPPLGASPDAPGPRDGRRGARRLTHEVLLATRSTSSSVPQRRVRGTIKQYRPGLTPVIRPDRASDLERTTGFEPATPTLARWCSTN